MNTRCKCSGEWGPYDLEIVDKVQIPAHLPAGKYVVGFRWDCEESNQVWSSCSDVTVVAAAEEAGKGEASQLEASPTTTTTITTTAQAPASFLVDFDTDIEGGHTFTVNVTRAWAPLGADHFYQLVQDKFYDGAAFFRVVSGFVLQFGIAGTPAENRKWKKPIKDDPVKMSNKKWTVSYATMGPNTRTSQLFINYVDNARLDKMGFAPIGMAVSGTQYLTHAHNPTPDDSGGVDQDQYTKKGDAWIRKNYPGINFVTKATIRS